MRRAAPILVTAIACAHQPVTDRPVQVTPDLVAHLKVALSGEPAIQIDDSDCDDHDRSRVTASFDELRQSLVAHGFLLVDPAEANLLFEHHTHVTTCTYDGQLEGSAQLIAKDRSGRTIEIVSLFPLWPDGLVDLILTSDRLAAFARDPAAPPVRRAPPPELAVTSTAATFSIQPMEGELDPALADQLVEYLIVRLTEGGALIRDDAAHEALTSKFLEVGDRCVISASLFRRGATERTGCSTEELMDAIDRIASRLR